MRMKICVRRHHPQDTVIRIGDALVGGGNFLMIAGPCAVESKEQLLKTGERVKAAGADVLRGGAFKPRTSPYSFQGLGEPGLELLTTAGAEIGLPVITELTDKNHLPLYDKVDVIQVGAKNMQNYELLRALGKSGKPVLLKRGMAASLEELLLSAEYILAEGNPNVILCERGIRTFNRYTRNTLDIAAIPALKAMTHLPVLVDPSHAAGRRDLVRPLALAAAAAGADGIMIEVHPAPDQALCDGNQAITPEEYCSLAAELREVRKLLYDRK